jgi:hypothetical protein
MSFDFLLFGITAIVVYNIYVDNQLIDQMMSYHKYYKMAGVLVLSICIYRLWRWAPNKSRSLLAQANSLIQTIPTTRSGGVTFSKGTSSSHSGGSPTLLTPLVPLKPANSTTKPTKRVVSETKKKFVAARQGWKCRKCSVQLSHTFEVDHVKRLDAGGTNDVDNLVAMCRECHGYKTSMENM